MCLTLFITPAGCLLDPQTTFVFLQGKDTALQLVQLSASWYSHNLASGVFERVPRMPPDLPQQLNRALEALSAINEGVRDKTPCADGTAAPCLHLHYAYLQQHESMCR